MASFNPHPTRRSGATLHCRPYRFITPVSILTRLEGRVQQGWAEALMRKVEVSILTRLEGRVQRQATPARESSSCFNPHPTRRSGATQATRPYRLLRGVSILTRLEGRVQRNTRALGICLIGVSILTRLEGRVQPRWCRRFSLYRGFNPHPTRRSGATSSLMPMPASPIEFQSSPDSKVGCNMRAARRRPSARVSILTRLEGRVQRPVNADSQPSSTVSILTRLEGRVQQDSGAELLCAEVFQSSPDSKVGCNVSVVVFPSSTTGFNPHPTRRSGATIRLLRNCLTVNRFQSSPDSKVGCNKRCARCRIVLEAFQSSPDSKVGCNINSKPQEMDLVVSILTRLEGRVQRSTNPFSMRA